MLLADLCSRPAVAVATGAPMSDVARLMQDRHVGAVVVTEGREAGLRPVGIITDRDIVGAQLAHTADLSRLAAGDVMTRNLLVIGEDEPADGAIAHLRARGVRRAPVVSKAGTLIGLISADDLLAHLARELIDMAEIVARQPGAEPD
jgi:CBS domain-containing protein